MNRNFFSFSIFDLFRHFCDPWRSSGWRWTIGHIVKNDQHELRDFCEFFQIFWSLLIFDLFSHFCVPCRSNGWRWRVGHIEKNDQHELRDFCEFFQIFWSL
jgi:hypothetical protein